MEINASMLRLQPEQTVKNCRAAFPVSGEVTLPGSLREAAHILHASATCVVERAEAMQDRASIAGRVVFRVLYTQGDPARTDSIEAAADFTHLCDLPGATARSVVDASAAVEKVDATVSGVRLTVRAHIRLDVRATTADSVDIITAIPGDGVQSRTTPVTLRRTAATGSTDVLLREEFELPADLSIRDTLSATALAALQDVSGGQGRIGVTGEIALEAVHLSDIPGKPIVTTRHTIPVQHSVETAGEVGDLLHARIAVKDVAVASQVTDDGAILRAEVLLGLSAWADTQETIEVLSDAYTTSGDALRLGRTTLPIRTGDTQQHTAESWKGTLLLPDGAKPIRTVLAAFAAPIVTGWEQQGNRLVVTGSIPATLLYMPDDGAAPASAQVDLPLRASFAASAQGEERLTLTASQVEAVPITSDRAEVRCILQLSVEGQQSQPVTLVTEAAPIPAPPEVNDIVLCYAQSGESWWDVARRYRTTEERLHALNPGAEGELQPGQGLVIWRQHA